MNAEKRPLVEMKEENAQCALAFCFLFARKRVCRTLLESFDLMCHIWGLFFIVSLIRSLKLLIYDMRPLKYSKIRI